MADVRPATRASRVALALFGAIAILIGWDLVMDYESGTDCSGLSEFWFQLQGSCEVLTLSSLRRC